MKHTTGLAVVFAIFVTLVGGMAPGIKASSGWHSLWDKTTNATTTASVGFVNLTSTTTTTSKATIQTASANLSIETPYIGLYDLKAAVDDKTMLAQ